MATVEQRFRSLLEKQLRISDPGALNSTLSDLGVNSVDALAFCKAVINEFGVDITPEDVANLKSLQAAIDFIDAAL
ncbi:MAG: acyl carrier protein [Rhodothermaceae bacterium]|nr:phosphopantetheine-binding protein [Bacteroidota bacterium]MXX98111.1 acyl carrier protein [Rhodothermaceae bacterium]MCY3595474.1 phosphopantetheine-binding protein [Bacteroidota bacterium]MXZ18550.1 acyl carrier protein [Rhodothermaceae bacterium]MXZ57649.1 acyl carrier protein [Rhodothermaceae bacterium]